MSDSKWQPLECDPDVISELLHLLGISRKIKVYDILSFDDEFLSTISNPVLALLFLFPYTRNYKGYLKEQKKSKDDSQVIDSKIYFMRQTVSNSCGTLAVIHAVANNMNVIDFEPQSVLKKFVENTKSLSPEEKANKFEKNSTFRDLHEVCARLGVSEIPSSDIATSQGEESNSGQTHENSDHHYITFVNVNSTIYELDGYKDAPIPHGSTTEKTLLKDAARVCLEYVKREPSNIHFSALAFGT